MFYRRAYQRIRCPKEGESLLAPTRADQVGDIFAMGRPGEKWDDYYERIDKMKRETTGSILDFQGHGDYDGQSEAFHPGWKQAEHEEGVAYICPWEDPYAGFPEHSRRCARALDDTGMPTHMRSIDPSIQWHMYFEVGGADKVELSDQYNDLLSKSIKRTLVEIYQIVPEDSLLQRLTTSRWLDPKQLEAVNRFRIISCVFERDRVSDYAVKAFNRVGMVWVANRQDKAMLKRCGVERVAVVPIPHFPDDPLLSLQERKRQPGPVRFYHIGKWEPRKAHHEMLGVFLMAFKPGEAKLYFKTSTKAPDYATIERLAKIPEGDPRRFQSGPVPGDGGYPSSPEESVHEWMKNELIVANGWTIELVNQNIHLIKRRVSPEQIRQLHKLGDVYLSLSRGEGFDMPAYDAKLAGNMVVYTPSGGPQDFATGSDILVLGSGDVPCHPFYRWGDARYLDWRYEDAVGALTRAKERVESDQWSFIPVPPGFTAEEVGEKMRNLLDEVMERGRRLQESE